MRFAVVLNSDGGTLKTTDVEAYSARLVDSFGKNGHAIEVIATPGEGLKPALSEAFGKDDVDCVIVAGGDGSVSAAAALALDHDKMLGIIPAGTMNLFARSLGIPLDIQEAADSLAAGSPGASDVASANGKPFLHQFSVGLHSRMVRERNRYRFASRLGKIGASLLAAFEAISQPVQFPVRIDFDGTVMDENASAVAVSNNPYGEGHLPYADRVDQGRLGLYVVKGPLTQPAQARLLADLTLGTWRNNPDVEEFSCKSVELAFPRLRRGAQYVMDGELIPLPRRVEIKIHAGALKVWLPRPAEAAQV
ncbi:MAG: diacylglycerol kinase family lipid kinase [Nitratireductor sp.]|jgi:diacylglycerol kinase family enzyme|nr:diacylglycerol kinase family lipid kinase [Nitratireductor sp.]